MKAHALANLLLQGPDLEVVTENECADDGLTLNEIQEAFPLTKREASDLYMGARVHSWDKAWSDRVILLK